VATRPQLRLTSHGAGVLGACAGLIVIAVVSGYAEFAALGVAGLLVVLIAFMWPRVTSAVHLERVDVPRMIGRGDTMRIVLTASSDRATPPVTVIDQFAGVTVPIDLPGQRAGMVTRATYDVMALRRGAHELGPLLEERHDPFGLVTRTAEHDVRDEVLVHPKVHPLWLVDRGSRMHESKARVPRFSDDPLADFRSLREYVVGDDERLVHWPTFARTGTLMVRDHFELRRTSRTVVVETLDLAGSDAQFEDAVEIAASLVCESLERSITVTLRTRDGGAAGSPTPVRHRTHALELLSRVRRTTIAETLPAARLRLARNDSDQIFVIGGGGSPLPTQLSSASTLAKRLAVVRLTDGTQELPKVPVRCVDITTVEQFVQKWNQGQI
jgi:uncharacterized protein (DUF58 family)